MVGDTSLDPGAPAAAAPADVDANTVVAWNLRAVREQHGWTHAQAAEHLCTRTGQEVTEDDVSAMEDLTVRHRFDAQQLYLFSVVFGVPIAYFFVPPPDGELDAQVIAGTRRHVVDLYAAFLGRPRDLGMLDERLRQVCIGDPDDVVGMLRAILGMTGGALTWNGQYRNWRADRLNQWGAEHGRRLEEIATFIDQLGEAIRVAAPEVFLAAGERPISRRSTRARDAPTVVDQTGVR